MSILSNIANSIVKTAKSVVKTETTPKSNAENTPNAVVEVETEAPVDVVEIGEKQNTAGTNSDNTASNKAVEQTIQNIPSEKLNKKAKVQLLEKATGLTVEEFKKLPAEKQKMIFEAVQYSIQKFEDMLRAGKLNRDASLEELITEFTKVLLEALESGDYKTIEEYDEEVVEVVDELGENFESQTVDEQQKKIVEISKKENKKLERECKEAEKLPEAEQEAARTRAHRKHQRRMLGGYEVVCARYDSKTAANAIILVDSNDLVQARRVLSKTRCSAEERSAAADYMDMPYNLRVIKAKKEAGDPIEPETLQVLTEETVAEKTAEGVETMEVQYEEQREMFENALKKAPEDRTPEENELVMLMEGELITAIAGGIGTGALMNINMDDSQKAEFIARWDEFASHYDDYEQVVSMVNEQLENNPEYSEIKAKVETIKQERATGTQNKQNSKQSDEKQTAAEEAEAVSKYRSTEYITRPDLRQKSEKADSVKSDKTRTNNQETSIKSNKSSAEIPKVIKEKGFTREVMAEYGCDAIKVILEDTSLSYLRPQIAVVLKTLDLNSLMNITSSISGSAFVYALEHVNEAYRKKLLENREQNGALSYVFKWQVEEYENA